MPKIEKLFSMLLIVIGSIAVSFGVSEFISRAIFPKELQLRTFILGDRIVPWGASPLPSDFKDEIAVFKYCYEKSFHGFLDKDNCATHTVIPGGFRKGVPLAPKRDGVFRIVVLGDSFTFGDGVEDNELFTSQLTYMLEGQKFENKEIEIINLGIPAVDTAQELEVFNGQKDLLKPDLVILQWNTNDFPSSAVAKLHENIIQGHYMDLATPPPLIAWSRFLTTGWREYTRRKISHQLVSLTLEDLHLEPKNFEQIGILAKEVKDSNADFALLIFPELYRFSDYPYQPIIDALLNECRDKQITCINLLPELKKFPDRTLWVHPTDLHPNKIAHHVAAEALNLFLRNRYAH